MPVAVIALVSTAYHHAFRPSRRRPVATPDWDYELRRQREGWAHLLGRHTVHAPPRRHQRRVVGATRTGRQRLAGASCAQVQKTAGSAGPGELERSRQERSSIAAAASAGTCGRLHARAPRAQLCVRAALGFAAATGVADRL